MKLYIGFVSGLCGNSVWGEIQLGSSVGHTMCFIWMDRVPTNVGALRGIGRSVCRPGSFEEFFSGIFGIWSFLCTNLFRVKYSWDGKAGVVGLGCQLQIR
jgi:hypothetical protein